MDENRYEIRKLEFFNDGAIGYADKTIHTEETDLGLLPVPALNEINKDKQFGRYQKCCYWLS